MPSRVLAKTAERQQRADARRNVTVILDAATVCLARDPDVSVADIAAHAGLGRITVYGHFKTRTELVDAVLTRVIEQADEILGSTDTTSEPAAALERLVDSSWQIVQQFRNILAAAQRELPPERIRGVHDRVLRRVTTLISRGQQSGVFRTDLPKRWLTDVAFALMHAAADEVNAGRLNPDKAADYITKTLLASYEPPRREGTQTL